MSDYLSVLISANLISTGGVPELSHVWSLPREGHHRGFVRAIYRNLTSP